MLERKLCKLPKTKTTSFGVESLSFKESFLWNRIKQEPTITRFKNKIKNLAGEHCTCRICQ